ncbi:hypothetical protein PTTG_30939, partial [Puccinia triticina 1-1 BBBD Race 1]
HQRLLPAFRNISRSSCSTRPNHCPLSPSTISQTNPHQPFRAHFRTLPHLAKGILLWKNLLDALLCLLLETGAGRASCLPCASLDYRPPSSSGALSSDPWFAAPVDAA